MNSMVKTILVLIAVTCGLVAAFLCMVMPPRDISLASSFQTHRADFEQLRELFLSEEKINHLASWGVEWEGSIGASMPPDGGMSTERFNTYLSLLKKVGGLGVWRSTQTHPEVCILMWATGFGGNTLHRAICWLGQEPTGDLTYRHIDSNWYLKSD